MGKGESSVGLQEKRGAHHPLIRRAWLEGLQGRGQEGKAVPREGSQPLRATATSGPSSCASGHEEQPHSALKERGLLP